MNSKRAKMVRSVVKSKRINSDVKEILSRTHKFIGVQITDRHVYKYLKTLDKKLNSVQKGKLRAY